LPQQPPTKFHHLARNLGNSRISWRSKITSSPSHRGRFLVAGQSRAGQPRQVLARLDYSVPYGPVPKDKPITFDDVAGKFTVLRAVCPTCDAEWNYPVRHLIRRYGRDTDVTDWLDANTADCPNRDSVKKSDRCRVAIPALARITK
jgi:hypothetical protein